MNYDRLIGVLFWVILAIVFIASSGCGEYESIPGGNQVEFVIHHDNGTNIHGTACIPFHTEDNHVKQVLRELELSNDLEDYEGTYWRASICIPVSINPPWEYIEVEE